MECADSTVHYNLRPHVWTRMLLLRDPRIIYFSYQSEDLEKQLDHEAVKSPKLPNEAANQQAEGDGEVAKEDCRSSLCIAHRASWLWALVLGTNNGLVLLGVSARNERSIILLGITGLITGVCSMAVGEFVSVSS
ncbi:hypothetical protein SELMODRAFT_412615 [Selaginella moellendorffii]|uniref:Uncharacterized protein n=1 Tax=Selaginella moellendorffii TaxID=88036 RepID=D8RM26_SELML|nr:hypothetical protein SELMODRAFT_412615 [Selaginella moellendorffii]